MNIARLELENLAQNTQSLLGGIGFMSEDIGGRVERGVGYSNSPAWVSPPDGHFPFDSRGTVAIGAVGTTVNVLTFTVPDGNDGVVERLSVNFTAGGFLAGSGDLIWRIIVDGKPYRKYDNIDSELGTLQIPRPVSQMRLFSGQVVTVDCDHVANAALNGDSIVSMAGYYYPRIGR